MDTVILRDRPESRAARGNRRVLQNPVPDPSIGAGAVRAIGLKAKSLPPGKPGKSIPVRHSHRRQCPCIHRIIVSDHARPTICLNAAGFENAKDIVAIRYSKEAGPGRWENDKDAMAFEALRAKYLPNVDRDNTIAYAGYGQAASMTEILRRCGDDLTRANVLKQASTLAGFHSPFFLDDINFSCTPDDYSPMKTLHISIFDGKDWQISEQPVTE